MSSDRQNALNIREHDSVSDGKKVILYGWTGSAAVRVQVDANGVVQTAGGQSAATQIVVQASQSSLNMTAFQGGAWEVHVSSMPAISISSVAITGGSLSAYQGGVWNVNVNGGSLAAAQLGTWNVGANGGSLTAFQGGTWNVGTVTTLPARVFTTDSIASTQEISRLSSSLAATAPVYAVINIAANGDNCIVPATSSKQIVVLQYSLVVGANGDGLTWKQGTTAVTGQMRFAANGGIAEPYTPIGLFKTALGASLYLNSSLGSQISGHITYVVV